ALNDSIPSWRFYDPVINISQNAPLGYQTLGIKVGDVTGNASGARSARASFLSSTQYISAEDDIINNGEFYELPIKLELGQFLLGFQFQLELDANFISLNEVQSELNGFSASNYTISDDGTLNINWRADDETILQGGELIEAGTTLFTLKFQGIRNGVFSRDIRNGHPAKNKIAEYGYDRPAPSELVWDNAISTGTRDLAEDQTSMHVFPNPLTGPLQIQMEKEDHYLVNIYNAIGQTIQQSTFQKQTTIMLDEQTTSSFYIVEVTNSDGKRLDRRSSCRERVCKIVGGWGGGGG
ncbi:MAG: T9SS type A sorting domain-containing protein, partial [Bacteroidota bacterium]